MLLALWALARLHPFVPSIDPGKWWRALRPFLETPLPASGGEVFRLCIDWLLAALLIEAASDAARTARFFLYGAGAVFALRVAIAGTELFSADIDGAVVALLLWLLVFRRAPGRHAILAAVLAVTLVSARLAVPHVHAANPRAAWRAASVPALLRGAFEYGGLAWLLARAGMRPWLAVAAAGALLLIWL